MTASAMSLLESIRREPGASNRRLASLTGLGVTKDSDNDGVLPTYISYLHAMDLIAPGAREDARFVLTETGVAILTSDPHAGGRGTTAVMAMLLSEPLRGAHLFDWAVRGVMSELEPFPIEQLRQQVERLSTEEGYGPTRGANYEVMMRTFTEQTAFGSITPWRQAAKDPLFAPQIPADLETPLFWATAFLIVRRWPDVFPNTCEAGLRDIRKNLLNLPRGVMGIRGRTEEQLLNTLQREGIISTSAVTTERVALLATTFDLPRLLANALTS
jgi:hypothetical protein